MSEPSFYDRLGLQRSATAAQIKAAYRRAASKNHPDKGGDAAAMQEIQQAFECLSDPDRRARYDSTGIDWTPTSLEADAQELLRSYFSAAIDAGAVDVVVAVRIRIERELPTMQARGRIIRNSLNRLERRMERMRRTSEGPDVLREVMRDRIAAGRREAAETAKAEQVGRMAAQMAAAYVDEGDPPPERALKIGERILTP